MKRYINLLPPYEQQELKVLRINAQVRDFGIWLVLSLGVLAMLFAAIRFYLNGELANSRDKLASERALLNNLETAAFREELEQFNAQLGDFKTLQAKQGKWSGVLMEIAQKIPRDLTLDRFSIDRQTGKVEIAGRGASRDSVLEFRRALLESLQFANVDFPLSNLEKAADVSWRYRFYVKEAK